MFSGLGSGVIQGQEGSGFGNVQGFRVWGLRFRFLGVQVWRFQGLGLKALG